MSVVDLSGTHALGGERHGKDAVRRWFERFGRVFPLFDSRSTISG